MTPTATVSATVSATVFAPKSILVPVDVDVTADAALAEQLVDDACAVAKMTGARMTLLHVAIPVLSPMSAPPLAGAAGGAHRAMLDVLEARNAHSARRLKELQARAQAAGVDAEERLATDVGSIPEVIAEVARKESADLIVMTTHGRRGLKRLLLGSVAERTAHLAHADVLLLRPARHATDQATGHAT
jgi:nucleotide-binding universal stress UspA family protein